MGGNQGGNRFFLVIVQRNLAAVENLLRLLKLRPYTPFQKPQNCPQTAKGENQGVLPSLS